MPLTDTATRNARPLGKPYKLSDAQGLYLPIKPNVSKLWHLIQILILVVKFQLQRCCLIQYAFNISVIQQIKKRGNLWPGIPRALNGKFCTQQ